MTTNSVDTIGCTRSTIMLHPSLKRALKSPALCVGKRYTIKVSCAIVGKTVQMRYIQVEIFIQRLDTILSLVQLVRLKIFITSHGCFLEYRLHPLKIRIITNWVREIFALWVHSVYFLFFSGDWNGINLDVYQSSEPHEKGILPLNWKSIVNIVHGLHCSEAGDYVFDHNANFTLSRGRGGLG